MQRSRFTLWLAQLAVALLCLVTVAVETSAQEPVATLAQGNVARQFESGYRQSQDPRPIQSGQYQISDYNSLPQSSGSSHSAPVVPASYQSTPNTIQTHSGPTLSPNTNLSSTSDAQANKGRKSIAIRPKGATENEGDRLKRPNSTLGAFLSVATSLAVVLLVFFGVAALYKKSQPANSISRLPSDVIQVLGRTHAGPRQSLVVLKFGSKLVLVSQQPGQTETISEITDPEEVERLTKICSTRSDSSSASTANFANVLKQVTGIGRQS